PLIAVVGILRPRMFVAVKVLDHLDPAELAAAIAHEQGHLLAADNFKRVVIDFCAAFAWWMPGLNRLRTRWAEAAELAADEYAAAGSSAKPLNLASALVKLARLTPAGTRPAMPAGAFLVEATGDILSRRISWLIAVNSEKLDSRFQRLRTSLLIAAAGSMVFIVALALIKYELFAATHQLIEFTVQ
ncbi:MAG: M56 family metallopeptidase, partial [Pyrinomonadaceae bacterium]